MSLTARVTAVVAGVFLLSLASGWWWLVRNARTAVAEELAASMALAAGFVELLVTTRGVDAQALGADLARLPVPRHLRLAVRSRDASPVGEAPSAGAAPRWFAAAVTPEPATLARTVPVPGTDLEVLVAADPRAEIAEAWVEVRSTLVLLALFAASAIALSLLAVRRAIRPLTGIASTLQAIGSGDYGQRAPDARVPEIAGLARDANRIAERLAAARAETRRLRRQALAAAEQERRRLAHELHDELGQAVTAIRALATSIERAAGGNDAPSAARARAIGEVAAGVSASVRAMTERLRPPALDALGLASALQALAAQWRRHHAGVDLRLELGGALDDVDDDRAIAVYRIVQEALTNVARHAGAGRVSVSVRAADGWLRVTVADDGTGIPPGAGRGLGLAGIEERANAWGGRASAAPAAGGGTRLEAAIPLDGEVAE